MTYKHTLAAFNTVRKHLIKQGSKASNSNGSCMYLDYKGRRCAIGCLLNYEGPAEGIDIEGAGAHDINVLDLLKVEYKRANIDLLGRMQDLHDGAEDVDNVFANGDSGALFNQYEAWIKEGRYLDVKHS